MKETNIAYVGDWHLKKRGEAPKFYPAEQFPSVITSVNEDPTIPVLILMGDNIHVNDPIGNSIELANCLADCQKAVYMIVGNHELPAVRGNNHPSEWDFSLAKEELVETGKVTLLQGNVFVVETDTGGVGITGITGSGGGWGTFDMLWAEMNETVQKQAADLERGFKELQRLKENGTIQKSLLFMHYTPTPSTIRPLVKRNGRDMPLGLFGCGVYENIIDQYAPAVNLDAVFHAHVHHGFPEGKTKGGTRVINGSLPVILCGVDGQPPPFVATNLYARHPI